MAFREVTMLQVKEVIRLWLGGNSIRGIARRVGMDRKTVRGYLERAEALGLGGGGPGGLSGAELDELVMRVVVQTQERSGRARGDGWAECEQHKPFIESKLKERVRLTKIRKLLRRQGIGVSYATLRRFAIEELEFGRSRPTIPVADCGPGEELQVDTGWVGWLEPGEDGRRRRFRAWIFTSVLSRHRFVYPVLRETTQTAIEACEAAWAFYGGVFKVLIPDNTKAIVVHPDALHPRLSEAFLEYSQARGFHVDPARVGHARDKGRVERAVQSVAEDCFAGERIRDLNDARQIARHWCLEQYGLRRHTRTQRMPREHFEGEEKDALLPAPEEPYDIPVWCEPKVAPDQHAQVLKALYSLPRACRRQRVKARADRSTVRFYFRGQLVKVHPRQPVGGRSTDRNDFPEHKAAYAFRDTAYLRSLAESQGPAIGRFANELLAGELPWTRMRQVYALLSLSRRYGAERVNAGCELALAADILNVHRLRRLIEIAGPSEPPPQPASPKVVPFPRYLRSPSQYALSGNRKEIDQR
jgi:transposase